MFAVYEESIDAAEMDEVFAEQVELCMLNE